MTTSIGLYLVPMTVCALQESSPGLELTVHEGATRRLTEALLDGKDDVAVT